MRHVTISIGMLTAGALVFDYVITAERIPQALGLVLFLPRVMGYKG